MHTHYTKLKTKLKTKVLRRTLQVVFMIMFLLGTVVFLAQRSKQDTPPVYASINQIYPNLSATGDVYLYGPTYSSCWAGHEGGHEHACFDKEMWKTPNMFETESDGTQTYKQSGSGWWGGGSEHCCQGDNWQRLTDTTRNHPSAQSTFVSQSVLIPSNINKITQVKFYDLKAERGDEVGNVKLELFRNSDINNDNNRLYQTSSQGSGDFTNLNWTVTPNTTYKIKLTSVTPGRNLSLPVTSPCSSCTYYIQWGPNVETRTPGDNTSHSQTDAYPSGGAESQSSYYSSISGDGRADIARMAVWGETLPKTCTVTPSSATVASPASVNVTLSGNAYGTASEQVRLWVEKQDGTQIGSYASITPPVTQHTYDNKYYYALSGATCHSASSSTCTTTTAVSLPVGSYYFHCDVPAEPGRCSGNPFCSSPVGTGTVNCSDWLSCSNSDFASLTVNAQATPPSITSLKMDNASSTQTTIQGRANVAGRQATQQGAGWLNPMKLTVNASQGSAAITRRYVAFYDKKRGGVKIQSAYTSSATFLSDITTLLNDNRRTGFLLAYGSGIKTGDTGNNWYVWDPASSSWVNIPTGDIREICSTGTSCTEQTRLYRVFPGNPDAGQPTLPNTWQIQIDKNLGSKEMYTAVYVVDNNNLSAFSSDITPTQ